VTAANCVHSIDRGKSTTAGCAKRHGRGGVVPLGLCESGQCEDWSPITPPPLPKPSPVVTVTVRQTECGRWRRVEGPKMWAELHARPAGYRGDDAAERAWLETFARRIRCRECETHWRELVAKMPPDLASAETYWRWGVDRHNDVNARLGKAKWEPHLLP
jgi:hypothetical protein